MMLKTTGFLIAFSTMALLTAADEKVENPFAKSKVGDFVSYKTTTKGVDFDSTMKQTVVEKDDKKVVIETVIGFMGKEQPATKTTIDLTAPLDPEGKLAKTDVKIEKKGTGKETLEVGGKKYECEWIENKVSVKVNNMDFVTTAKTWTSKDIPLGGMVKTVSKTDFGETTVTLVEFGNKK